MTQQELADAAFDMIFDASAEELGALNASQIARKLGVSLPNLSRAFHDYYKWPLSKLLLLQKFEWVRILKMVHQDMPIKKILEILDIRNLSHFNKQFKAYYGLPPVLYTRLRKRGYQVNIETPRMRVFLTGRPRKYRSLKGFS